MRSLFAALVALLLALTQAWGAEACACESVARETAVKAACCCDHALDARSSSCGGPCASVDAAAPEEPPAPPSPGLDTLSAAPSTELPGEPARIAVWTPALARGPPGETPPLWLRDHSLLR